MDVPEGKAMDVITSDVRDFLLKGTWASEADRRNAYELLDDIDETHSVAVRTARKRGFDEGFASADDWYAEKDDETLADHGLVRLPVDADGKPILPGDEVADSAGNVGKVDRIKLRPDGWHVGTYRRGSCVLPKNLRHYRKPTPAERIRAWCEAYRAKGLRDGALEELDAIAEELEGEANE